MRNQIKISEYFWLHEFESPDTGEVLIGSPRLLECCDKLRKRVGQPMSPSSAYRTKAHNKKVGGAPNSQHQLGTAVDFPTPKGLTVDEFAVLMELAGFDGIGRYDWGCHGDVRGAKARWDYRAKKNKTED